MSVFPYTYYMIVSFKITSDDSQIALYAGMITSAFAFAEFTTSVVWGSLSDRIGRKPVLIAGLAGTGVSMMIFGFAPSLPVALLGRAMGGFLNGNIGVIQTTVAELVPTKSHQARAYTIMPFVWSFGSLLGSAIGGTLAQPCDNYPDYFARGTILDKFPFLLPNLVCTAVVVCGVIIGILFLEETHAELKDRRDYGLEAGNWIVSWIKSKRYSDAQFEKEPNSTPEESRSLLEDEQPPGYQTTEGTPKYPLSRAESPRLHPIKSERAIRPPTQKAFTKQVVWTIIGYGILA
ncbi:hypothetical protein MMC25_004295 [Agyrium rufum]|nr:hypothetical protein [Agyrium rufum]